jgi:hypothetical protein
MIPGAPHQEGTQRETHNRLEASFKNNKHKLMPGDASSVLEMREFEGALKASLSFTWNHSSTQTLAQRNQVLALGGRGEVEWMLKWVFVPWLVSNEWGGRKEYLYQALKTSFYCALTTFLGTSDPGSELPRGAGKLNNEAISVLPTQARYYRSPG